MSINSIDSSFPDRSHINESSRIAPYGFPSNSGVPNLKPNLLISESQDSIFSKSSSISQINQEHVSKLNTNGMDITNITEAISSVTNVIAFLNNNSTQALNIMKAPSATQALNLINEAYA